MNWSRLESRIRGVLRSIEEHSNPEINRDTVFIDLAFIALTRIDEILAAETRRGNELTGIVDQKTYDLIVDTEWKIAGYVR